MDLDIKSAVYTISHQLLQKLDMVDKKPYEAELALLQRLAENRESVIESLGTCTPNEGKEILLEVLGAGHHPYVSIRVLP